MYTHNLSDPADIQTCFDPVSGIGDGTAVGHAYYIRQVFGGLTAFDSNVQEITPSNTACPAWLLPLSGNILGTVAVNNASNSFLRFFFSNDPGLTASTSSISANCMIYHWEYSTSLNSINESYILPYVMFALSGTPYIFTSASAESAGNYMYYSSRNLDSQMLVQHLYSGNTNTTMANFPKILFWKSGEVLSMFAVNKNTSAYMGGGDIYNRPHWEGFASSASATSSSGTIINGQNFNAIVQNSGGGGSLCIEGFNRYTSEHVNAYSSVDGLTYISSAGKLPDIAFSVSSSVKVITTKLRIGLQPSTNPKFIATHSEIDNVLLVNSSLYTIGTIQLLNGIYYYVCGYISDGKNAFRKLLQLSG